MSRVDILGYTLASLVLLLCIKIFFESEAFQLKCIISEVDGNKYCVREREKLNDAADLLAKVTEKCKNLVRFMEGKYPDNVDVQRLVAGFNPQRIVETLPTSKLTAYSENKGEKIAFCLNKQKNGSRMIELNTPTFVAIHELAHVMTVSIGHKPEFWNNFKFLLENAKEANIYNPIDYKENPADYCGMTITDNPYYDM